MTSFESALFGYRRIFLGLFAYFTFLTVAAASQVTWSPGTGGALSGLDAGVLLALLIGLTFAVTALLVFALVGSFQLTLLAVACPLVSCVWVFGVIYVLGLTLTPELLLAPYLIYVVGVSHALQQVNVISQAVGAGASGREAALAAFRGLSVPGTFAFLTDAFAFAALTLLPGAQYADLALIGGIGMAMAAVSVLILLPLIAASLKFGETYIERINRAGRSRIGWVQHLAPVARAGPAKIIAAGSLVLLSGVGYALALVDMSAPEGAVRLSSTWPAFVAILAFVVVLLVIAFRDGRALISCVLPLVMATAMAAMILLLLIGAPGVTVLPLLVVGLGIGVDFAFYLYAHIDRPLRARFGMSDAFVQALEKSGVAVMMSGLLLGLAALLALLFPAWLPRSGAIALSLMFFTTSVASLVILPAISVVVELLFPRAQDRPLRQL